MGQILSVVESYKPRWSIEWLGSEAVIQKILQEGEICVENWVDRREADWDFHNLDFHLCKKGIHMKVTIENEKS